MKNVILVLAAAATITTSAFAAQVPVYRKVNLQTNDHLITLNPYEAPTYRSEGLAFILNSTARGGRSVPIFRCDASGRKGDDHFASTSANCEGTHFEGLLGFASIGPNPYAQAPLYRCWSDYFQNHLITTEVNECTGDYRVESVLGFVPYAY